MYELYHRVLALIKSTISIELVHISREYNIFLTGC